MSSEWKIANRDGYSGWIVTVTAKRTKAWPPTHFERTSHFTCGEPRCERRSGTPLVAFDFDAPASGVTPRSWKFRSRLGRRASRTGHRQVLAGVGQPTARMAAK